MPFRPPDRSPEPEPAPPGRLLTENVPHTPPPERTPLPDAQGENREDAPTREYVLKEALNMLEGALAGFEDYALFGSTALYLRKQAAGEHGTLPEDLDLICEDERALTEVKKRLARIPGVRIDLAENGQFFSFPSQLDAKFFSGWITVGDQKVPFECFSERRIAGSSDVYPHRSRIQGGLMTLTGEGLKNQYLHTLEMDRRIDRAVRETLETLVPHLEELEEGRPLPASIDLTPEDAFWLKEELMNRTLDACFQDPRFRQEAARRFAAIKTKTERRLEAVKTLHGSPIDLESADTEKDTWEFKKAA